MPDCQPFDPFLGRYRAPFEQTHLSEPELVERLHAAGITPPDESNGRRDWNGWWVKHAPRWTPEQSRSVWELLTKMRFYRVVEEPVRALAFAVLKTRWTYSRPACMAVDAEGGELVAVHRTQPQADADSLARTEECKRWSETPFEMDQRGFPDREFYEPPPPYTKDPRLTPHGANLYAVGDVSHFEVREVVCEREIGETGVLASLTGFTLLVGQTGGFTAEPLVPERAFPDQPAAEAAARREFAFAWYGLADEENGDRFSWMRGELDAWLSLHDLPPMKPPDPDDPWGVVWYFQAWWHEHGHRIGADENVWLRDNLFGPRRRFYTTRGFRFTS